MDDGVVGSTKSTDPIKIVIKEASIVLIIY